MIEVQAIAKSFGKVEAVRDVSFRAEDGQITALLGPNGAGKTTTLRVLCTVIRPDRGRASVDGFDCTRQAGEVQRRIGVLPDNRGLYVRLTAREHIQYYGRLHGLRGEVLERRTNTLIEMLDMHAFADRRVQGFSQGQRVKVALARALVHDPHNIILDEPTTGLDVPATRALRAFILQMRAAGRCVLFSSHIMQEVAALCDRVVIVAHGRVVADGTQDDIRNLTGCPNLEDAFVAAIGSGEGLQL